MYHFKLIAALFLALLTSNSYAQSFESKKDLLDYYKENPKEFGSPKEGWHNVWVILPYENDFVHEFGEKEVIEASVLLEEGLIKELYYEGYNYTQKVYPMAKVKKGKATFQKLFVNINSNLTEVYSAYTHHVLFKDEEEDNCELYSKPLKELNFYTTFNKVEKQGFYLFVKNSNTKEFDFIGYLNQKCKSSGNCKDDEILKKKIVEGDYHILSIQNKILFNRQMPKQEIDVHSQSIGNPIELLSSEQLSE